MESFVQIKNAFSEKTKKRGKIELSFLIHSQEKLDVCILRVSSLEQQGYKPIDFK